MTEGARRSTPGTLPLSHKRSEFGLPCAGTDEAKAAPGVGTPTTMESADVLGTMLVVPPFTRTPSIANCQESSTTLRTSA